MAVASTADFVLTRNEIIASALRKVKGMPDDGNPPAIKVRDAIRALNLLLRQEDLKQTGASKSLWALSNIAVPLADARYIYTDAEGLATNITELISVVYRDTLGGETPLDWLTQEQYDAKQPKNQTGDPVCVYLKKNRLLTDQELYVWPAPADITAGDTVRRTNVSYLCILKHTSATENAPGTGPSASLFWKTGDADVGTDTWATATAYSNGPLIFLTFKRPLFDFDAQYDNPDFPAGWGDYIIYKLALRLAPEYDLGFEQRNQLRADLTAIEQDVMPSARPVASKMHNYAKYF